MDAKKQIYFAEKSKGRFAFYQTGTETAGRERTQKTPRAGWLRGVPNGFRWG
jgi:hypothetical protein